MQSSHDDAPLIITIGRQMGCGGRELGRLLASRLGIGYYDKELLIDVARQAGMPPEYLASKDERTPSFLSGVMSFTFGHSPVNFYATRRLSAMTIYMPSRAITSASSVARSHV